MLSRVYALRRISFGILGQVWYLIVSIPDLCTVNYFNRQSIRDNLESPAQFENQASGVRKAQYA